VSDTTRLPFRGDFQWFGMGGAFVPSAEQVYSTRNYHGFEPKGCVQYLPSAPAVFASEELFEVRCIAMSKLVLRTPGP
jgi:hypothetical protein